MLANPPPDKITTTWIGHSTVLTQFEGLTILTDPVFSQRCSPSQFFGPKRYRNAPCTIKELPQIDAVCISHNHYDHLDYNSIIELNRYFGHSLTWFVAKGLKEWFQQRGCKNIIGTYDDIPLPPSQYSTPQSTRLKNETFCDIRTRLVGGMCSSSSYQIQIYFRTQSSLV